MEIGSKVRARRKQLQLSMDELARRAGVSYSFLSKLERGETQPLVGSLVKIAQALEVSSNFFIEQAQQLPPIKSSDQYLFFSLGNPQVRYARMGWGDGDNLLEPILVELLPQCNPDTLQHFGEAFFTVLEGQVWVSLNQQEFLLAQGHSIHVKAGLPYGWRNATPQPAKLLWVGTPKLF